MKRLLKVTAAALLMLGAADLSACKKSADTAEANTPPPADNGSAVAQDTNATASNVATEGNAAGADPAASANATNSPGPY